MTPALLLSLFALGADPAPLAVTKAPPTPPAVWSELRADPILTTLVSPTASKWLLVDDGADLRASADGKSATFGAASRGRYRILVVPEAGEPVRVAVLVGDAPAPVPPPTPGPVDPPQSDLGKRLQAAFDADPAPRAERVKLLADKVELYRQAAVLAAVAEIATTGQLVQRVKDASRALGGDGLADIRRVVAGELAAAMPTDEPMTADLRIKAAATFTKIRNALQEVK